MECPCGSGEVLDECCGPIIDRSLDPLLAENLMRSRYTAFTQGNGAYLFYSHHSSKRKKGDIKQVEKWAKSVKWIRLDIIGYTDGQEADDTGTVEFIAVYFDNGQIHAIEENSLFKRELGVWKYVEGV